MIHISSLHSINIPESHMGIVHPFYADSFSTLYGISKREIFSDERVFWCGDTVAPMLKSIIQEDSRTTNPKLFLDIRTTEEFSKVAPEYSLLYDAGLYTTSPLSIKGMDSHSIVMAFMIASTYLSNSDYAICCAIERYHQFDNVMLSKQNAKISAFIISADTGDVAVEKFGFLSDTKEIDNLFKCSKYNTVISNDESLVSLYNAIYVKCGLVDPLSIIREQISNSNDSNKRILSLLKYGNKYGFYIVRN